MSTLDTTDPIMQAVLKTKPTAPSDPVMDAVLKTRPQAQPEMRGLSGYRDDIGGTPGGPPAIAQPTPGALNVALGVPQQPQGNPQDFFGAAPAPVPTYDVGPTKPFANPGDLGEGQAQTSLHRPDSLIAALEQGRAERAASQQAGFLGRTVGATQTALAGGLASATANIDRLAQAQPPSMRPQLPLTSDQVADQMFGVTPEHKQIAQHAGPVESTIAQTVAMPTAFLDPTAIGPMKITGDVGAVLNKELPVFLARLEATAGTKTAKMVEATLHGAGGMGTFSGAHAAMSYPDWATNPEGGMASVKDAIAHGVVAGAGYGLGGGLLGLPGQIRDERNTKSLEAGKQAQQDAATAFAQGKRQGQWAERENPAATEPYRTSPTTPPEPSPTEPAPTATEQPQAPAAQPTPEEPPANATGTQISQNGVLAPRVPLRYRESGLPESQPYTPPARPWEDQGPPRPPRSAEEAKAYIAQKRQAARDRVKPPEQPAPQEAPARPAPRELTAEEKFRNATRPAVRFKDGTMGVGEPGESHADIDGARERENVADYGIMTADGRFLSLDSTAYARAVRDVATPKESPNVPQPEEVRQEVQGQARPDAPDPARDNRAGDAGTSPQEARPLPAQEQAPAPGPRVLNPDQPKGKPLTRQSIEKTLMERHEGIAGPQEPNENAGTGGATRAFYKRIPTELSEKMNQRELDAAGVQVVDQRNRAGGEDYVHDDVENGGHGGDWDSYIRELKGDSTGPKVAAAKKFFRDNTNDPEAAFLTALHDQIPKGGKLKNIQQVKAKLLKAGDTFKVNGIDVRVEDAGEGERSYLVLKDGDELPETPLEALDKVPMDKGSMGKTEQPKNTAQAKAKIEAEREAPKPTDGKWTPETGGTLHHGTDTGSVDTAKKYNGMLYLTDSPAEAQGYADGIHRPGEAARGEPQVFDVQAKPGKTKDLGAVDPEELDDHIADARAQGYRYVTYEHPSNIPGNDGMQNVVVMLNPHEDVVGSSPNKSTAAPEKPAAKAIPKKTRDQLIDEFHKAFDHIPFMQRSTTIALADQLQRASGETPDAWWSKRFAEFTDRPVGKGEDALHQDGAAHAPQWHSKLRQTVEAKMGGSMDASALRSMLTNAGVKPEEMEWSRVGDLSGKVTKQQVLDHLDEHAVKVEEVGKGEDFDTPWRAAKAEAAKIGVTSEQFNLMWGRRRNWSGGADGTEAYPWDRAQNLFDVNPAVGPIIEGLIGKHKEPGKTKFQQYQLPGGENYRELLLTMPVQASEKNLDAVARRLYPHMANERGGFAGLSPELQAQVRRDIREDPRGSLGAETQFTASHWDEPNVLAHIRFNDRTIGGKKVLFVEEIQSDWHQKGREQGYKTDVPENSLGLTVEKLSPDGYSSFRVRDRDGNVVAETPHFVAKTEAEAIKIGEEALAHKDRKRFFDGKGDMSDAEWDALHQRVVEHDRREGAQKSSIPNAPFKKNWHELAMKRVIRYAAENGYDKVAWTPGDIQNERYDLSKQVDSIRVGKDKGGKYWFEASKDGRSAVNKTSLAESDLADHIGKDLAKKAIDDLSKEEPPTDDFSPQRTYKGVDLQLGGSGMRGFYDDILPKATDKIIKKWGGKVGLTDVPMGKERELKVVRAGAEFEVHEGGRTIAIYNNREAAQQLVDAGGDTTTVHGFDVTPAMREEVLSKGQPLFQGGKRGAVQFLEDGRAIVHAFEGADVSTAWHEIGHVLRRNLPADEQAIVDKHFGIEPGQKWTREHEEAYSEAWENYGKTGKAPTPELQPLFDKMREWLVGLYTRIKSGLLGKQMDPVMSDHFDRMLVPKNEREAKASLEAKKAAAAEPPPKAEELPAPETKAEPIPEPKPETTGIKNAVSAVDRLKNNMGERELPPTRSLEEMYDSGKQAADKDPQATTRLIQEMRDNPEKIISSDEEAGLLLKHKVDMENELHRLIKTAGEAKAAGDTASERIARLQLAAHREQVRELTELTERAGTAAGRALVSRKAMSDMDYSLSHMEAMTEAAKGEPLTDAELAKVKGLHEEMQTRLKAVEADRDAAVERAAKAEAEAHHQTLLKEAAEKDVPPAVREVADRFLKTLNKAADGARARIKARGIRLHAGIDPIEMADYAIIGAEKLARGLSAFADWSGHMIAEVGEWARPHLNDIWDASQKQFEEEAAKLAGPARGFVRRKSKEQTPAETINRMRSRVVDGAKPQDLQPYLHKIALGLIREGITDREKLLTELHSRVKAAMPPGKDISKTQVRDALSGYGNFKPLDMDAAKARLREVKGESQKLAQLEALQQGEAPKATGVQRQAPSDEARRLTKLVNEAKKKAGLTQSGPRDLKTVLDTTKTRIRNQIADLQTQIDTGLKNAPSGKPVAITDAEIAALKKQKDQIQQAFDEAFPNTNRPKAPTPPRTDAQKLATATRAAKTMAEAWERKLADAQSGKFAPHGKPAPLRGPELDALKAKATAAREAYNELKSLDPQQKATAEAQANQAYRTMLAQREADLHDRISQGNFAPKPKRAGLTLDNQSLKAKANLEATRQKFNQMAAKFEASQRPLPRKIADTFVKWVRESALSYPSVLAKLTGAAVIRTLSTPVEQAVGAGLSKALPKLAAKAPREGVPNIRDAFHAEAEAQTRMWTKGMKGSWDMLRNRRTELELALGKDKLPPELIGYLGRLHGALKNPVKEAEFARSLTLRTAHALRTGIDTTDPIVQLRLSNEAYMDANRAIFMQDNKLSNAWNSAMGMLESKDKTTGKPTATQYIATVLRTELPIVKVPSNVLAEASEVLTGMLTGPAKAAWAYHKGIENLKPAEADIIMRLMKKGSIGAAMLGLGFFGYKSVGGFYQKGEHRTDDEPQPGDIGPVPHALLHNPYMEAVSFGATIRKAADAKLRKKQEDPNGLGAGLVAASVGLIEELPWIREVSTIEKLLDPYQRDNALGRAITGKTVPGIVQWAARKTDRRDGEEVKRHPAGVMESIKAAIPGLRQSVPEFATANQAREKMHRLYESGKKAEALRIKLQWNREHPKEKIGETFIGSPAQSKEK